MYKVDVLWSLALWFEWKEFSGGRRGFCGAWVPSGSPCFFSFACGFVFVFFALSCWCVFSFAFELLILSIILSVFLFAVLNCLNYIIVLTWTIWSTCTFGHEFKLLLIIKMRFCIVKNNRKININIDSKTLSLRSKIVYTMSKLWYFDLVLIIWSMI